MRTTGLTCDRDDERVTSADKRSLVDAGQVDPEPCCNLLPLALRIMMDIRPFLR